MMSEPRHTAENEARPTHVAYRITGDYSYEETPCWCPNDHSHPVSDTRPIPPEVGQP